MSEVRLGMGTGTTQRHLYQLGLSDVTLPFKEWKAFLGNDGETKGKSQPSLVYMRTCLPNYPKACPNPQLRRMQNSF